MTFKDFPVGNASFVEYYKSLPDRRVVKAPKSAFVEYIAHKTLKSEKTVRMWIAGVQTPDALTQKVIAEELGVPQDQLFPEKKSANIKFSPQFLLKQLKISVHRCRDYSRNFFSFLFIRM